MTPSDAALAILLFFVSPAGAQNGQCPPTPPDAQGPYYREGAPVRNVVGEGYLLLGQVKSTEDCSPIPGAKVELWMAGPSGRYGDEWRATVYSDEQGRYWYQTDFPGRYGSRPPHIHIIADAPGYEELVTQHYPEPGTKQAVFDLVLISENSEKAEIPESGRVVDKGVAEEFR